jgi:peptide/nickel transport system substrate-binding protein
MVRRNTSGVSGLVSGRFALLVGAMLAVAVLFAACGPDPTATPRPTATPTTAPEPTAMVDDSMTDAMPSPTEPDTGGGAAPTPTPAPTPTATPDPVIRGGVVSFSREIPSHLDTTDGRCGRSVNQGFHSMVHDSLIGHPSGPGSVTSSSEIVGYLAEEWETINPRTYRFTLRDGLAFHDGRPVTSNDIVLSMGRLSQKNGKRRDFVFPRTESMETDGDKTMVWTLKFLEGETRPLGILIDMLSNPQGGPSPVIMPEESSTLDIETSTDSRIGSGPFKFVEWRPGDKMILERNDAYIPRDEAPSGYAGGKNVYVDQMEWVILPDPTTRAIALEVGEIDISDDLPPDDLARLSQNSDLVTYFNRLGLWYYFAFNHLYPPFDNVNARKAVQMIVDQEKYMRLGYPEGLWDTCLTIWICGTRWDSDAGVPDYVVDGDLAGAQALWGQSGYAGEPILVMATNQQQDWVNQAQAMKEDLESLGAEVDLQVYDTGAFFGRLFNPNPPSEGGWNMYVLFGVNAIDPLIHNCLRNKNAVSGNHDIPALEELKNEYLFAPNEDEARALVDEMQTLYYDEAICVTVGQGKGYRARRADVKGVISTPAQWPVFWNIWLDR